MSVGEAHTLGDEIVVAIKKKLPESRIQIHVEPCDFECKDSCVSGCLVVSDEREAQRAAREAERADLGTGRTSSDMPPVP